VYVFVGAFSDFGGPLYRIPAPIFSQNHGNSSDLRQRGVGVRWRDWIIEFGLMFVDALHVRVIWYDIKEY
jgi:hypothetical protein